METYDYSSTNYLNKMIQKIETLSEQQASQVLDFLDNLESHAKQEQASWLRNWFSSSVASVLQSFAEITNSCLTIEENENIIIATLQNAHGFEITESCQLFKNMLGLANHVGINYANESIELTLIFDCNKFIA